MTPIYIARLVAFACVALAANIVLLDEYQGECFTFVLMAAFVFGWNGNNPDLLSFDVALLLAVGFTGYVYQKSPKETK